MAVVFGEAVYRTLAMAGLDVLADPKRFLSYVMDLCDENSRELSVLIRNCDKDLLEPYAEVALGKGDAPLSHESLEAATSRAMHELVEQRAIDRGTAQSLCSAIERAIERLGAEGIADTSRETLFDTEGSAGAMVGRDVHPLESRGAGDITLPMADPVMAEASAPEPSQLPKESPRQAPDPSATPRQTQRVPETAPQPSKPQRAKKRAAPIPALAVVLFVAFAAFTAWHTLISPQTAGTEPGDASSGQKAPIWVTSAPTPVTFTFLCQDEEGQDLADPRRQEYEAGSTATFPECPTSPDGYSFSGWKELATGHSYLPGDDIEVDDDRVFVAEWKQTRFAVTFDGNGADSGDTEDITFEVGEQVTIPECTFERAWYRFDAWVDPEGLAYYPGDEENLSSDLPLRAMWVPDSEICLELVDNYGKREDNGVFVACLGIKNISEVTLDIGVDFDFVDDEGKSLAKVTQRFEGIAPGQEIFAFQDSRVDGVEYTNARMSDSSYYAMHPTAEPLWPSIEDVAWDLDGDTMSITCKNVGDCKVTVSHVTLRAENYSRSSWLYLDDEEDIAVEPGETFVVTFASDGWGQFDERRVYFYGKGA